MLPMSEKPRGFTIDHKVERVALSRDGRRLLVSRWGRNQLLEAPSGKEVMALPQGEASLSPDGTLIAVCPKADGLLHVWQVDSGREKFTQMDRGQRCTGPVFSPDGRFLLAQCDGDKLVLRDVASGRMLRSLPLASGMAMTADFSADGSTLVAIIWSGNQYFVQFWPCHEAQPLEHLIEQERARIGRELTADEREMLGLPRGAAGR
jgi:WD40 repeat protein